jgi:predicted GIY-YIG superfamily endonuclease
MENIDINDYDKKSVFYLFNIDDGDKYKFGITDDIITRKNDHEKNFRHKVIKLWDCRIRNVSINVENKLKNYIKDNKIQEDYKGKNKKETEVFKINGKFDIQFIINLIEKYVNETIKQYQDNGILSKPQSEDDITILMRIIDQIIVNKESPFFWIIDGVDKTIAIGNGSIEQNPEIPSNLFFSQGSGLQNAREQVCKRYKEIGRYPQSTNISFCGCDRYKLYFKRQ